MFGRRSGCGNARGARRGYLFCAAARLDRTVVIACLTAVMGRWRIIRGPDQRMISRIFSRMAGR